MQNVHSYFHNFLSVDFDIDKAYDWPSLNNRLVSEAFQTSLL